MQDYVLSAAIAGLLHDVGKFMWQAREKALREQYSEAEIKKKFSYWHALASDTFISDFMHETLRTGLSGVRYHHRPDSEDANPDDLLPWIVRLADHLSSAEREAQEDEFIPRLLTIFSSLEAHNKRAYLPLTRLNPQNYTSLFPKEIDAAPGNPQFVQEYSRLWDEFEQACKEAGLKSITDPRLYLETVLALLQEFTWCVPSAAYETVPDISLFDHLRVTSAIAACLAVDTHSVDDLKSLEGSEKPVCLLVWGDLSNLQKFIYNLASEGAARSLRARSFYVQLLAETLAHAIVHKLGLPVTNLVYVGGGGFQLLAPLKAEKTLPEIVKDLTERLLTVHQGELGLTVKWEQVKANEFSQFGAVFDRLGSKLNRAKRRPFSQASAKALFGAIGQPLTQGGDPLRYCVVTGEDGKNLIPFDKNSDRFKSKFVDSLEKLGLVLPEAAYIVLKRVEAETAARATGWQQALRVFGMDVHFVRKDEKAPTIAPLKDEFLRVWRLEPKPLPDEAGLLAGVGADRVVSYRPFSQLTPTTKETGGERPKTFDELADPVQAGCGFRRWGVLRMDVDNLGVLFKDGFGDKASLSRIASLSFALRLFFEGYLPELAKGKDGKDITEANLEKYLYVQYSGGDDVFIVGAWDALPEFARRIRAAFGEYAAGNPKVTLSGGMDMFQEKYPLYLAAEEAGDAESKAKNVDGKDAFCFLGVPLKWEAFETARQRAYRLASLVENRLAPRSLIQSLLMLYVEHKVNVKNSRYKTKPWYGRWMWLAAYQLTRVLARLKKESAEAQAVRKEVETLRDTFTSPDTDLAQIALSARWAQFLTRLKGE